MRPYLPRCLQEKFRCQQDSVLILISTESMNCATQVMALAESPLFETELTLSVDILFRHRCRFVSFLPRPEQSLKTLGSLAELRHVEGRGVSTSCLPTTCP